jgi:hypothetical protein
MIGDGFWDGNCHTGLAIMRRDGFASMDARQESGTLTTRPVRFTGKYLFVNVDNPDGQLHVEVLTRDKQPIEGLTFENCNPVSTDSTIRQVTWNGGKDLSSVAGKPVRFKFSLNNGRLYSFWVSSDKSGASHGYVAAGGPGFTGSRDTVGKAAYR